MTETAINSIEKINSLQQITRPLSESIRKYDGKLKFASAALEGFEMTMGVINSQERCRILEFRALNEPSDLNQQLLSAARNNLELSNKSLEDVNSIYKKEGITSFEEISQSTLRTYENSSQKGFTANDLQQSVIQQVGTIRII